MKGKREILASTARSLLCQGMLIIIVYIVSNESHFGSMSSEGVFINVVGIFC